MIPAELAAKFGPTEAEMPEQVFVEVSGPYTVQTDHFEYAENYEGMEIIHEAGTVIGFDGETPVKTPYDDCVLVMPSLNIKKGFSALRYGKIL